MNTTYNGWTNYETWLIKLWIDNNEESYDYWREQTRDCWRYPSTNQFIDSHRGRTVLALAERLKNEHEAIVDSALEPAHLETSFVADLLTGVLSDVDWREIAEALVDAEELTEEESEMEDGV